MSTTVSYKGSTIATVDDQTKILSTKGTWLEDDITITDAPSGNQVVVVDTPDSHGGTVRTITAQNVTTLQGQKQVTLSSSPQTISPDTGYDGFSSVVVTTDENMWDRPSDWPPYANGWNSSNFDGLYFIYDLFENTNESDPEFYALTAKTNTGTYTVECGYVSDSGVFTAEYSNSYSSNATADGALPTWDGVNNRYFVIKVTPTSNNKLTSVTFANPTNATLQTKINGAVSNGSLRSKLKCVEIYGRLPNVTQISNAFGSSYLQHIYLRDLTSITGSIAGCFNDARRVEKIEGLETWDTKNVTNMSQLFRYCYRLQSVSGIYNWDVGNVENMSSVFESAKSIKTIDLSNWTVSSFLTNVTYMFRDTTSVKTIKTFKGDVSGVTSCYDMFRESNVRNVEYNWTGKLRTASFSYFHINNAQLETELALNKFDFSSCTNLNQFYNNAQFIRRIDFRGADTSKVTTMQNFASSATNLRTVDFTGCNFSSITDTNTAMFSNCNSLLELKGFAYPQSFNISASTLMSVDALVEVLTNLPTVSGKTITLGTTNKNKLSAAQIAIATGKGWTVA